MGKVEGGGGERGKRKENETKRNEQGSRSTLGSPLDIRLVDLLEPAPLSLRDALRDDVSASHEPPGALVLLLLRHRRRDGSRGLLAEAARVGEQLNPRATVAVGALGLEVIRHVWPLPRQEAALWVRHHRQVTAIGRAHV
eukprot:CAMPEP_0182597044 /NCGR_PEP_ID=MMETSP1324-20130603/85456_1 /TAXON_ID=236786 /ORGANISM="Florenciella sp., Strain RCC1587" /LENGTH=139 /DNA_ID=CAMNT_0024814767 /DNA_START=116 /DNA_END=535 /DNA_ORIENTATION=-